MTSEAHGIITGGAYRFKVTALNFNGEGAASPEALIHVCLPPTGLAPPTYVSSTETTLSIAWQPPEETNACPIYKY